jgi:rhodanese-related sulfurtransferase
MPLQTGYKALLEAAEKEIRTLSVDEARALHGRNDVQFVDIRDIRELQREGRIPGAFHATRGMLEFWIDPDSPYFKDVFGDDKTFVFYCQSGWRSALATQTVQRMGLSKVCHIGGGFRAWKDAGGVSEELPKRD